MQDPASILAETTEGDSHPQHKWHCSARLGSAERLQALSRWKSREMGCIGTNGSNGHRCSCSAGSSYEWGTVQSTWTASGSVVPKAKSWQAQESWMLSLGNAFLSQSARQKGYKDSGHNNTCPVAKAVLILLSCVVSVPLHLLSRLRPYGLRQRNAEVLWTSLGACCGMRCRCAPVRKECTEEACSLTRNKGKKVQRNSVFPKEYVVGMVSLECVLCCHNFWARSTVSYCLKLNICSQILLESTCQSWKPCIFL